MYLETFSNFFYLNWGLNQIWTYEPGSGGSGLGFSSQLDRTLSVGFRFGQKVPESGPNRTVASLFKIVQSCLFMEVGWCHTAHITSANHVRKLCFVCCLPGWFWAGTLLSFIHPNLQLHKVEGGVSNLWMVTFHSAFSCSRQATIYLRFLI